MHKWMPAKHERATDECATWNDEEDFVLMQLTTESVQQPTRCPVTKEMVIRQVVCNPSSETLHLPAGTVMGLIEETECTTMLEELQLARATQPEMVAAVLDDLEDETMKAYMEQLLQGESSEEAATIALVAFEGQQAEEEPEQPSASRSEPLKHQPKFELPARHRYAGRSGNEMVAHVREQRSDELCKWREEHKAKLNFGTHNTAEEANRYAALLFASEKYLLTIPRQHQ